ncbi:MAG: hypothetical protein ACYS9Y_00740 [Planctomycetota bacterium]|jgi:hypothetical protein
MMTRLSKLAVLICVWFCFQVHAAEACKYNVRDTGFVDLGTEPYYLYGYVREDTPVEVLTNFKDISYAVFMDTNVKVEMVNVDEQKGHPAIKYIDLKQIESFPTAVVVSPDGQLLSVEVTKADQPFKRSLLTALEDIVSSVKRDEIIRQVSEVYAAVLLFEGPDEEENKDAREAALEGIDAITRQMKLLPKAIAEPPVLVEVSRGAFSAEKVLLWSLGLEAEDVNEPYAAVIYGRARWIGPLMRGEQISANIIANILYVIGADCECGLDRSLMQGTMLPARWGEEIRAKVAKGLGFDPENPMIKMEINRILRMGASSYPGVPFGYQELVVDFDGDSNSDTNEPEIDADEIATSESSAVEPLQEPLVSEEAEGGLQKPFYIILGLGILILGVGLFIILKAGLRKE